VHAQQIPEKGFEPKQGGAVTDSNGTLVDERVDPD
jgi:hypothetical protein